MSARCQVCQGLDDLARCSHCAQTFCPTHYVAHQLQLAPADQDPGFWGWWGGLSAEDQRSYTHPGAP